MSHSHAPADSSKYYLPHGTPWPIIGSVALFTTMLGVAAWLNDWFGPEVFALGLGLLAVMFIGWFRTVIGENQQGVYNLDVDRSFRMGMIWFIFSEVMFFAAFFGALFYARQLAVPWLGGEGTKPFTKMMLWPEFSAAWPTNGPALVGGHADGSFGTIPAFGLPALAPIAWNGVIIVALVLAVAQSRRFAGAFDPDGVDPSGSHALAALLSDQGVHVVRVTDARAAAAGPRWSASPRSLFAAAT